MLIERVFEIGGALCVALGLGLAYEFTASGLVDFGLVYAAGLAIGFGVLFIWVGRGARRERQALLRLGEEGSADPVLPPRAR